MRQDPNRKTDPRAFDAEEDYTGPLGGSYFKLSKERDEQGRPMGFLSRKEAREQEEAEEAARWAQMRAEQAADGELMSAYREAIEGEAPSGDASQRS